MLRITFVGAGAIAAEVHTHLIAQAAQAQVTAVVRASAAQPWRDVPVRAAVPFDACDLVIEMAGAGAVAQHVVPALQRGIPCFICSVGALADAALADRVSAAAERGGTAAHLMTGAIGAIDALSAAAVGGLDSVRYTGRKPPQAWTGTPAEALLGPLDALTAATVIFEGSAREAALAYPKNANVAATVALAGIGFDATRVTLIADPAVDCNVHRIEAEGGFGRMVFDAQNRPAPDNPRTSVLTAYSVVRAVRQRLESLRF